MRYKTFTIKNYKGIKDLVINLDKDPKVNIFTLVGLNESGKTTVLEAIEFFVQGIPQKERYSLVPRNKQLNFNEEVTVQASFEVSEEDLLSINKFCTSIGYELSSFKLTSVKKGYGYENSDFKSHINSWTVEIVGKRKRAKSSPRKLTHKDDEFVKITRFVETELFPPIIYYENFLFDFPKRIYLEKYENESKEQEDYRLIVQDILDSLSSSLNVQNHILDRMKSDADSDRQSLESVLNRMSEKITRTVFDSWGSIFRSPARREIVVSVNIDKSQEAPRFYLEIKVKEGTDNFRISERSLGFRWFFAFLLFTEFRKNRAKNEGEILFLLDEPASNLHSTAQSKILNIFHNFTDECKLIYTTHSHHLINPEWLEGTFIVKNSALDYENEFEFDSTNTNIDVAPYREFVGKYPNLQTYFQPILDSLDYRPSELEFVPEVIVVEGKNDFYTLRYINDVVMSKKYDFNFYPGNGAGKNGDIIALYLAWGREFKVLLDSDTAGETAKKDYIDRFGALVKDRIFTLKNANRNWTDTVMEDLFTDQEKILIGKELVPTLNTVPNKKKLNLAIQNSLFFNKSHRLGASTVKKFERIFVLLDAPTASHVEDTH